MKKNKSPLVKLLIYIKSYYKLLIPAIILAIIATIFTIIGPTQLKVLTDEIVGIVRGESIDYQVINRVGIFLVIIYSLAYVFNYLQGFIIATVTQRISYSLRKDIDDKINVLPLRYFDNTTVGDILSRVSNDVDTLSDTLNRASSHLISGIILLVGSTVMMFVINYILALVVIVVSLLGFSIVILIIRRSQKYFIRKQKELGKINGHIEEIYSGHNVIKAYNGEKQSYEKFSKYSDALYTCDYKSQFYSGTLQPLMTFLGNLSYASVFVVATILMMNGVDGVSLGTITAFMVYIRLFTQPLNTIAQATSQLQSASASALRVFEILEEEELSDESHKEKCLLASDTMGNVVFDHVQFGYNSDRIIIKDFSLDVKKGQKIAIVGPTGAGKTTLVNLLMRFYEVNKGHIYIDGIDTSELTRENVHEQFAMVLQDTWLFNGTIRENLVYNQQNISDEEIYKALKAVGLKHFINTLPHKLDTIIDEKMALSNGQKQQLTIARAMLRKASLLILDEATSNVDTKTEKVIQEAMDRLTKDRTSFVIAHRLSTIKNADVILVLKDGDIVEKGNHEELIAKNGAYKELYNAQFETN
ncbi:MAG: ABC transporter ATP-binding protein [Bacilli bacterium]|nr:ABC transporter ATP-binding protein [Bacilli bacterium]